VITLPYTRDFLSARTGRLSQIGGITHFTHADGKAKGVSTLRVRTAQGFEFWVVPDRGMDIFEAAFQGKSLCWHSPGGMVHPAYYSNRGSEMLKSFAGGLFSTCGLTTVGSPSEDNGENLGLHGPISNIPAESVSWSEQWKGEDCLLTISGKVREASVHGPNLLLERTISTSLDSASFSLHDVIENQGVRDSPLMLLYHFNFGFPLLTERSRIYAPSQSLASATEFAANTKDSWNTFESPQMGLEERVYFHHMRPGPDGKVTVVLVSDDEKPDFGIALTYAAQTLPEFVQWKMTAVNHFVLGLEPANCRTLGRRAERQRGTLQTLAPGERREFQLELRVLSGAAEIANAIASSSLLPA
jgi:hypothetical protein